MSEAERILRRSGGQRIPSKRHVVYLLNGERFTLHRGSKQPNRRDLRAMRCKLRRMGLRDK